MSLLALQVVVSPLLLENLLYYSKTWQTVPKSHIQPCVAGEPVGLNTILTHRRLILIILVTLSLTWLSHTQELYSIQTNIQNKSSHCLPVSCQTSEGDRSPHAYGEAWLNVSEKKNNIIILYVEKTMSQMDNR